MYKVISPVFLCQQGGHITYRSYAVY